MRGASQPLPRERGAIIKKWGGKIPICIVYPNGYYTGMSNLAVHILYKMLNDMPDVVCERAFIGGNGQAVSVESGRSLSSFEIVFFSFSFELDYIHLPGILREASIPISTRKRGASQPIIVAGGICLMANPEPVYDFIDLFLLGDVEAAIPRFMETYREYRGQKRDRVIEVLSILDFVYNPHYLNVLYRDDGTVGAFDPHDFSVKIRPYKGKDLGRSTVVTDRTEFSGMFLIEGTRGCPSRCPFCLLGNTYAFTCDTIEMPDTEDTHIGLIGGGVSFHPRLLDVLHEMKAAGKTVHLPSLRVDKVPLAAIETMKDDIKTLTFGIEAATEKLRKSVGKPLADRDIFDKIDAIVSIKPFNIKLYFMIGLYNETMDDINAIVDIVKHLRHIMLKRGVKKGSLGNITVHASPFVPKAGTPFQWLPMDDMNSLKEKVVKLKKMFGKIDNTFFTHESIKFSLLQGILARADRRISKTVARLSSGESLMKVLREDPINLNFFVLRERAREEVFPWDFIDRIITKEALLRRLETSLGIDWRP